MNPTDKTGQLRNRIRELLDFKRPNGGKFSDSDLEEIVEELEAEQ